MRRMTPKRGDDPHDAERRNREDSGEDRQEEKRREIIDEIGLVLKGGLIIWDIVSVLLH
jgi:hypothetical protein